MPKKKKKPVELVIAQQTIVDAALILAKGLKYYEHDGHDMPKRVAREALEVLGMPREKQP